MSFIFSAYMSSHKDLSKFTSDVFIESQKIAEKSIASIKSGFVSLLKSISNSFSSLQKMFSSSKVSGKDKNETSCHREDSSFMMENKREMNIDDMSYIDDRYDFNKLKADMHSKLDFCFNQRTHS